MAFEEARQVLSQIGRGSGSLPHVGAHPGTAFLVLMTLVTGTAGLQAGGFIGLIAGFLFSAFFYGAVFAYGSYERAKTSDRIETKKEIRSLIAAWMITEWDTAPPLFRLGFRVVNENGRRGVHVWADTPPYTMPSWLEARIKQILHERWLGGSSRLPRSMDLPRIVVDKPSRPSSQEVTAAFLRIRPYLSEGLTRL